jgi:hypothetical protein
MTAQGEKNRANAYSRSQVRKQLVEAVGEETIPYYLSDEPDAKPFQIEHPLFRSQETKDALDAAEDGNDHELAVAILGDQYDAFVKAGGSDEEIGHLMIVVGQNLTDSLQNGRPTRR